MNTNTLRALFPMIVNNPEMVYLDTAASAMTPQSVIDAINSYYSYHNTNVSRGVDKKIYETTMLYEAVRVKAQHFIGAKASSEIIFTRGATTALNTIAFGFAEKMLEAGDEILLNIAEHHANIIPWQVIAKRANAKIIYVDLRADGSIDPADLEKKLNTKTKIVTFAHITNVLGSYNDPKALATLIRAKSAAYIVVDGAQAITQYEVDVQELDCDFYVFSGHKMFGPTGIGVLYGKHAVLERMDPFEYGGDMNHTVTKQNTEYKEAPHKFEAGTMMIAEVFGLGAAIDFMERIGTEAKNAHIAEIRTYAIAKMQRLDNIIFYNAANTDAATISFNIRDVHAHDAATVFSNEDVVVRAGHHCAQLLLEKLETTSSLRASFSVYSTKKEVDKFISACEKASDFLDVLFR